MNCGVDLFGRCLRCGFRVECSGGCLRCPIEMRPPVEFTIVLPITTATLLPTPSGTRNRDDLSIFTT